MLVYIVCAVIFGPMAALKARRMGQPFLPWLLVGMALPVITLAVVSWYEGDARRPRKAD